MKGGQPQEGDSHRFVHIRIQDTGKMQGGVQSWGSSLLCEFR